MEPEEPIPADFQPMLDRYQAATLAFGKGDAEPFIELWSQKNDVSLFGAFGPCRQGWGELSRTFRWVASRFKGDDLRYESTVMSVSGDTAYTVGYERSDRMSIDGGQPGPLVVRVTQIYRREAGAWKLVHRHGDFAPVDQSAGKV
jgi:ketosteroid isomerase-like protein